jgi:ATP-binding cassette subfamily B protein
LIQRRALTDVVAQVAATCAVFAALGFLTVEAVRGSVTLGSLVMYYQGFQSGMRFLQGVLQSLAGLYEDNLFLTNYHEFMDLTPRIRRSDSPRPIPEPIVRGIDFKDVSFTYPSSGKRVLQGVNLNLAPGQVIALVGANGSGKTTLVKLLCRLYDPEEGRIAVEDVDLREIDPLEWRRRLSVVFQDYVRYALSARDNIWFGNVALDPSHERVEQAARRAGANRVIESLPLGYETTLGFWFRKGQELSGGEWQKVALARAFMRDAQVVVLDEPTSSLDPLAEAEVFRHFRELVRGRSAILISHRFSTVQLADHIYVLDGGRILEHGSHRELVALGGLYSRLYRTQAQHYQ